jgi:hypothetical protein
MVSHPHDAAVAPEDPPPEEIVRATGARPTGGPAASGSRLKISRLFPS